MKKFFCCLKIDVKSGEEAFRGSESSVQQLPHLSIVPLNRFSSCRF